MKKIIFTLALTFATTLLFAQKNPFEKFTDMDGVTCVYISKNMMSLLPKDSNTQFGGVDVTSFIENSVPYSSLPPRTVKLPRR